MVFRPISMRLRMADSARRLEMPVFPEERFRGSQRSGKSQCGVCASVWFRSNIPISAHTCLKHLVIGVKPADEYQFRVFVTPVGPYFKGGVKPLTLCVSDFDSCGAAWNTHDISKPTEGAMSLHAIVTAHARTAMMKTCI